MSRPGGRSILSEIGRQIMDMVEEASREVTMPPYARPEDGPPRERPRPTPPWEREEVPVEVIPAEEVAPQPPPQRQRVPVARPSITRRSIRAQLQSKTAVRRALVMCEILGPPKSMSDDLYR
jgi:hypothetical protein